MEKEINKLKNADESVDKVKCCAVCFGTIITFGSGRAFSKLAWLATTILMMIDVFWLEDKIASFPTVLGNLGTPAAIISIIVTSHQVAGIGHVNSFGIIYNDFIEETHSTAKSMTTAHGVFGIMLAIGGIILNILLRKNSLRLGGIIGAITMIIGSFSTVFILNMDQFLYTFGILQGIGFGIMVPVCYSTLNHYFVRKRTTVMSICKALQGVFMIFYPHLLKRIKSIYGFRGTLVILSGIALHTIPAMLIMKMEEYKHKRIKTANDTENGRKVHENVDLLKGESCGNEIVSKEIVSNKKTKATARNLGYELSRTLNVKVLKDLIYCNICLGQSFVNFSDLTFFMLQPMLLYQYGYDTTQVATCISIGTGADVAGRCALAVISSVVSVNTRYLYYAATALTLLFRTALLLFQVRQFIWMCTITAALGVLRSWLHVASPVVIADHVTQQDFPGAYAVYMLAAGLVNVSFSPLIGLLKDVYLDYVPAFHALSACCLPCLVLWPVEYVWLKTIGGT